MKEIYDENCPKNMSYLVNASEFASIAERAAIFDGSPVAI